MKPLSGSFVAIAEGSAGSLAVDALAENNRSFSWDAMTLSEHSLGDTDVPQQTAVRTSLLLQVSAPVIVELGLNGRYKSRSCGPGEFCITPAGEPVAAARWRGERRILVAELSPLVVSSVADFHHLQSFQLVSRHGIRDPQVTHLLLALREELVRATPAGQAYVDMIARAIVLRLLHAHAISRPPRTHRGGLSRSLLRRVVEYIDEHLDQDLGLQSLATVTALSEDYFARAFRESTGVPPHRYMLQRRLERARRLLETSDMPIVEIAQTLGFADQSHLTNLFRRNTGMTPGQVRAQLGRKTQDHRNLANDTGILQESNGSLRLLS